MALTRHNARHPWNPQSDGDITALTVLSNAENRNQVDKERNVLRVLRCMCLLYESVGCAIRRVSAYSRAGALLRKPTGAAVGPFGNPQPGLIAPGPPRNPLCQVAAVWFLGMVLVRWPVCAFCMLTAGISAHNVLMLFRKLLIQIRKIIYTSGM
jgi:hypothetical protein